MSTRTPITMMAHATPSRTPLAARHQRTRRARLSKWLAALPVAAGLVALLPQTGHASISCSDYANTYAPTFYFHPDEQYLPVTMTAFIKHSTLRDASDNVLDNSMSSVADLINAGSSGFPVALSLTQEPSGRASALRSGRGSPS
jgi:hypothetical protein